MARKKMVVKKGGSVRVEKDAPKASKKKVSKKTGNKSTKGNDNVS